MFDIFDIKKFMPKRLFARGIAIIVTPILLLQFAIIYLTLERYWDQVTQNLSSIAASEIAVILSELDDGNIKNLNRLARRFQMEASFTPRANLPQNVEAALPVSLHATLERELKKIIKKPIWIDAQTLKRKVDIRIEARGGVLRILAPRRRVHAEKTYLLITWTTGIAIISLAIAIIFLRNQVRPIQRLAAAANRFGRGLDVREFKPSGASEVRQAGAAFLNMRDRLRRHIAQRTAMLGAISHDMRTALTRLTLQIAFLPENAETKALKKDVAEMETMLNGYLDFARGEGQKEKHAHVNMGEMLHEMTLHAQDRIALKIQPALVARLRPHTFRRCLDNLISNALAYGEKAEISAKRNNDGIEILIDDDGPGIQSEHHEQAFRPFHRLDSARNQDIAGTGLGLAIARDIARAAGGDITLLKSPLGGLRVRLFLPV